MTNPKIILSFLIFFSVSLVKGQKLEEIWKTDTIFKVPESVYADIQRNVLYVSNIGSRPIVDDVGFISKLTPEGVPISLHWVSGLNAPKGLALVGEELFVAELNAIAIINVVSGELLTRIPIPGAKMLNDVCAAPNGDVYVSDSRDGKIYLIKNRTAKVYIDGLDNPNGVLFTRGKLHFLDKGRLYVFEENGKKLLAEDMDQSTDGLEPVGSGDFIISCWSGIIYYLKANGERTTLLDTREQKLNTADIGWDAGKKIVYVPTFWGNNVVAYQLKF